MNTHLQHEGILQETVSTGEEVEGAAVHALLGEVAHLRGGDQAMPVPYRVGKGNEREGNRKRKKTRRGGGGGECMFV